MLREGEPIQSEKTPSTFEDYVKRAKETTLSEEEIALVTAEVLSESDPTLAMVVLSKHDNEYLPPGIRKVPFSGEAAIDHVKAGGIGRLHRWDYDVKQFVPCTVSEAEAMREQGNGSATNDLYILINEEEYAQAKKKCLENPRTKTDGLIKMRFESGLRGEKRRKALNRLEKELVEAWEMAGSPRGKTPSFSGVDEDPHGDYRYPDEIAFDSANQDCWKAPDGIIQAIIWCLKSL